MVQVRTLPEYNKDGPEGVKVWLQQLNPDLSASELERIVDAVTILHGAYQNEDTHEAVDPTLSALEVLHILSDLKLGTDALIAGLAHRAVHTKLIPLEAIAELFGDRVAGLLEGVERIAMFSAKRGKGGDPVLGQASAPNVNIRRMLIAIVDDVRVALIKLAERTVAMRELKYEAPEVQQSVAQEVFDVYAPLAHRLGIGHIKWELEDLSFRYTHKDAYHRIAKLLDGKRTERDGFITRVSSELTSALTDAGLSFDIAGRSKHIYSIWRKMQRKGIGFSQVYDIRAVRILVGSVKDCYHTLGIVHGMWRNIPNEFDDYIANPKENGYRSLHTAVIGPEGKILEVQIRTFDMHEEAELGVCAHWMYKGSDAVQQKPDTYEQKLSWLRQVLEWHEAVGDDTDLEDELSFESAQDRVYVFTPEGDVVSLTQGATPIDFAYHVHTEIGHRCRGAKVNGRIVPLTYVLATGDRVEILTGNEAKPRRDWLQAGAGFIHTSRAKASVRQWFRAQTRDDNIDAGRALVERECSRLALTSLDYTAIAQRLNHTSVEDMFAAVGAGDASAAQIFRAAQSLTGVSEAQPLHLNAPTSGDHAGTIDVDGVGNMLTKFARCCMPVPGDEIVGFITRSKGVSVHRKDCAKLLELQASEPERIISVAWGDAAAERFEADIGIEAYDRQGLLADVTSLMARAKVNVTAINTQSHRDDHTATMRLRVEVTTLEALADVLDRLARLDNVITARRIHD